MIKETPIFDPPNSGTDDNKGLSCSIGGYVDGVLGTLNGLQSPLKISKGCFNSIAEEFSFFRTKGNS